MAKRKDEGHEETEGVLAEIEKRINEEYAQAERELTEKINDYMARFQKKDALKRQAVQNGMITEDEYKQWRVGQLAIGQRWEEMRDSIAKDLTKTAEIAKGISVGYMPDVYAINHNYGTYQVEKEALVDTSYTLYDRNTAQYIMNDKNTLYKGPGRKTQAKINAGKQMAWDKKQIQSVMMQGLLQGESIGKIATRLAKAVGESDRKAAIRNARTMTTGVQNAGRVDSYKRAEGMGIKLKQEWLATLDGRTRHEHRVLDGQRVPVGEPFEVDGYKIEYPGDPTAEAFLVYNCRCTLVPALDGFEVDSTDLSLRNTNNMEEESYEEWKANHASHSDPITKQDDIEETMKRVYGAEYAKYKGTNKIAAPYISARNTSVGNPGAIVHYGSDLNTRQKRILAMLPEYDSRTIVKKSEVNMADLAALTAYTGDEFGLFTKGGQRLIIRGNSRTVNVTEPDALKLYEEGYKFSGHTHNTVGALTASDGDYAILRAFKMTRSVIYDPAGHYNTFELGGDD